jgi:diacylglycerol kinase (ATP)
VQTSEPSPLAIPDLVFVNPAAGGGHAADSLPSLRALALRTSWQVEFRLTSNASDLGSQASAAAATGYTRLFVLGGDGSFQDLVNATRRFSDVVLGILPAGGGNDLADALGLPHDPLRAAELLRDGKVCLMDAVRVETADGRVRLYTGGGGVGLDAEASYIAATRFRNLTGRFRYLLSAAVAFLRSGPISVRINWSSNENPAPPPFACAALLVAVLNTPSYGSGLRFAPAAKTNDGLLDLVLVEAPSASEMFYALPRLIFRGELRSPRVKRFPVHQVKIETDSPCRFHGDGEILGYTPVRIEVLPGAIRILCPSNSPFGC